MILILKTVIFFLGYIIFAAYLSLFERKFIGRIQLRLGPTQCGFCGLLQPIADAVKLIFKKRSLQNHSKQSIIAVVLLFFISLCQLAIIPLSQDLFIINPKYGILLIIFFHIILVFSEFLIGVSSSSKYGVIGGVREYLQIVGAHIPFILSLICIVLLTKTLNLIEVVQIQEKTPFCVILLPLFIIFFIIALILVNRAPFDFPEAESELVAGSYVEYGGILFALIYLSEYLNVIYISEIISTIFFGGYNPFFNLKFIPPYLCFFIKTFIIIGIIILIRAILPRYRQDQMIRIAWIILCPLIFACMLFLV